MADLGAGRGFAALLIFLSSWAAAVPALADDSGTTAVPASPIGAVPLSERPLPVWPMVALPPHVQVHAFWDQTNMRLFSGVALFRAVDFASTRNMQARGREEVLIPDDVAKNNAGFASLEAAATGASIAASYWLHRAGHHRLERWLSVGHITVTAFGAARNYTLKSKH